MDLFEHLGLPVAKVSGANDMLQYELVPRKRAHLVQVLVVKVVRLARRFEQSGQVGPVYCFLVLEVGVTDDCIHSRLMREAFHGLGDLFRDLVVARLGVASQTSLLKRLNLFLRGHIVRVNATPPLYLAPDLFYLRAVHIEVTSIQ